jgi:ribulose bisphosphate carboxylase small subunit
VGGVKMKRNLTREEVEENFPIGSIVEVMDNQYYEHVCSLGEKAKVFSYIYCYGRGYLLGVEFLETKKYQKMYHWRFKSCNVIEKVMIKNNLSCPNCNCELKDHYSEWAGKDIKKCKTLDGVKRRFLKWKKVLLNQLSCLLKKQN